MKSIRWALGVAALTLFTFAAPPPAAAASTERSVFTETERRILLGVLDGLRQEQGPRARHAGPPARRGLPPGLAKNLQRGQPLPPGIAKRYVGPDARRHLPPRERYEIVLIDDDAYLIGRATGVIVDILLRN